MPKKPLSEEIETELEEGEKLEEEETEESEPIDPDEQLRQQKKRILNKIEAQVNLSDFWQEVLATPAWNDILRIYYRLCSGIVKKYYASFEIKAVLVGDKIECMYNFFDKDGKEIDFDALNSEGVKE